jgi:multiple antibiotic resistance protein
MDYVGFFVTAFTTIFVIVDPPGNIPMFIAVTEMMEDEERNRISKKATVIAASLLILVAVTGGSILDFFRITLDSLKIAGGILLFAVSVDILMGSRRREFYVQKSKESLDIDSLAVFPIALPLYSGPGAITAAIVLYSSAETFQFKLLVIVSILLTYMIVRLTHIYSSQIIRILGKSGSDIVARLMAIFLAAIAVEYFFSGLEGKLSSISFR